MSATNGDGDPSVAHEIRITSHGKIKNWVSFALDHFQVRILTCTCYACAYREGIAQKYEDRPLVLHTLPPSKDKRPAPGDESETQHGRPPHPPESERADSSEKEAKAARLHPSMATIPRLVSVVEIIKREYLKTLDPALAQAGSLSGLHQYNEMGDLEEHGLVEGTGNEEQDRLESLAHALQGRNQCVCPRSCFIRVYLIFLARRSLKQKKTAFMRVSLCRKEAPELVRKGVTCVCLGAGAAAPLTDLCRRYQRPTVRKLSKSTRARLRKKLKRVHSQSEGGAGSLS